MVPRFLTLFDLMAIFSPVFLCFIEIEADWWVFFINLDGRVNMKIQVGGLSDGIYQFALAEDATSLELDGQFKDQVSANVTVEKNGAQIFLKAGVSAQGAFECDRCLTPFVSRLASSFRMYYVVGETADSRIDPAELKIVPPGFSVIDLSDDIRQTVLLSVPLKLLCREECKGLCPHCGVNLNFRTCTCSETSVDPRWEQLMRLKKQI